MSVSLDGVGAVARSAADVGQWLLQAGPAVDVWVGNPVLDVAGGAVGAFLTTLLVGAAVNGLLTLTGIGGLVSFCVGAAGFGAVLQASLEWTPAEGRPLPSPRSSTTRTRASR